MPALGNNIIQTEVQLEFMQPVRLILGFVRINNGIRGGGFAALTYKKVLVVADSCALRESDLKG